MFANKKDHFLAGAIGMLAMALLLNAAALFFTGRSAAPLVASQAPAQPPPGGELAPKLFFLGRDTYFITSNGEGDKVYLWHYDFSPVERENKMKFLTSLSAK